MKKGDFVVCKKTLRVNFYHFVRGRSYEVKYFIDHRKNPIDLGFGFIIDNAIINIGYDFTMDYEGEIFRNHFFYEEEFKNFKRTKLIDKI